MRSKLVYIISMQQSFISDSTKIMVSWSQLKKCPHISMAKNYAQENGKEDNIRYRKKMGQPERKSLMISDKLLPKWSKESSKSLTATSMCKKRSLKVSKNRF